MTSANPIGRRDFLRAAGIGGLGLACGLWPCTKVFGAGADDISGTVFKNDAPARLDQWAKPAQWATRVLGDSVSCGLCPHGCVLAPGDRGICRSRVNVGGTLYTLVYGNPCAVHLDPIEKKPLYHFKPASTSFSIATTGCNLRCLNCQNWEISQAKPHEVRHADLFPEQVVEAALKAGAKSIAYTYSEPVTFYEYVLDTAKLARAAGLANVLVSAGYINRQPLLELCKVIDAANVNLKSFDDAIYRKLNGARLEPILSTFKTLHEQGVHFEMTNLVVPGYADNDEMVKRMCGWILANLGPDHPLHFTRFFPKYRLDRLAPTPVATLERLAAIAAAAGIHFVYVGNVPGHPANDTYCYQCQKKVMARKGYTIAEMAIDQGHCRFCGTPIAGVWG